MQTLPRGRPLLIYGAVLTLLAAGVFVIPGVGPALLRTEGFAPHGVCILWQPDLLWFHVANDLLIGASYVAIAVSLAYLVYRGRHDLPFHWVLLAFGAFIITCGGTHFMEAWTFWQPVYWLSGYLKLITAIASVTTAIALPPLIPRVIALLDSARLAAEREQQLAAANAELAQLNTRLTELDDLKSQLFANVSHEFRTPLTLIFGPVERLLTEAPPELHPDLDLILRNARLLERHVADLLDVAQLEAGRLELQKASVDFSLLTAVSADFFATAAASRGMTVQVEAPHGLYLQGDQDQLQRVLVNLIGNALKFTPDGGTVRVSLRSAGEQLLLTVEDSGPGVPEAQREAIFERFRQGDGGITRRHGGTGLGLAIARELVVLHGGTISVGVSDLGGAAFMVTLPADRFAVPASAPPILAPVEPAPVKPAPLDARPADNRPHILLVEDNADVRRFVVDTLAGTYRVSTAADGVEGATQALALVPDLIISDVMMPGMSGEQLVLALRGYPELESTPIVMLTARADAELRLRLLRSGAQEYLLKPFSPTELLARLHNLLVARDARRTLRQAVANQEADLATLSAQVARLYAEAQAALRLRDEFIAVAAHELRTPITALLGNTQLLLRRAARDSGLPERDTRAVRAIHELSLRLAAMVERLLDIAQIERGRLQLSFESLDLATVVARTLEQLQPLLDQHTLVVEGLDTPAPVHGDADRLAQVLTNLLTNAVKYSPPGTTIRVALRRDAERVAVVVADEGIGVPEAALPQLFEAFYRAPNANLVSTGGFGVGLYLTHEIVRRHGGTVSAESVEGSGSTFTVWLPLRAGESST